MADEVPEELGHALDRLVHALDLALESGEQENDVASAVRECAAIAQKLGLRPELLVIALKPRLSAAAARRGAEEGERYFRALVTLAIESYFGDET
jgi:hypothetical protein